MSSMKSSELIDKYIEFFKEKGHKEIDGSSLIPENDPTVLFTTAGMHPLVPFLMGQPHPSGKKLVDVQKCIRTQDIDEVGDETHTTFFQMLGNWSLGDYFKEDAIKWSYEFLTSKDWLNLDVKRLAVTCFKGDKDAPKDEEAANIWKKSGISEERIAFLPKKIIGGDLQEKLDLVVLIQKCFIGKIMRNLHQLYLILMIVDGLKFGMMYLCNIIRTKMVPLLL